MDNLLPLLSDRFRTVALKFGADHHDYDALIEALEEADDTNIKNAGQAFWTLSKDKGTSIREYSQRLHRLLCRFVDGVNAEEVRQQVLKERLLQELPKDARTFIRHKDPASVMDVCLRAEQFYADNDRDLTAWDSKKTDVSDPKPKWKKEWKRQDTSDSRQTDHHRETGNAATPTTIPSAEHPTTGYGHNKWKNWHRHGGGEGGKPKPDTKDTPGKCQTCGGSGHTSTDCPQKVNKITHHTETNTQALPL